MFSPRKNTSSVSDEEFFDCIHFRLLLAEALTRSESYRSEVEFDLSKERSESAALRDLLCKIQGLNEGLAQDKIELNRIILLVRGKHKSLRIRER